VSNYARPQSIISNATRHPNLLACLAFLIQYNAANDDLLAPNKALMNAPLEIPLSAPTCLARNHLRNFSRDTANRTKYTEKSFHFIPLQLYTKQDEPETNGRYYQQTTNVADDTENNDFAIVVDIPITYFPPV